MYLRVNFRKFFQLSNFTYPVSRIFVATFSPFIKLIKKLLTISVVFI